MTIFDYLSLLKFAYLQTYSFNRGQEVTEQMLASNHELRQIYRQMKGATPGHQRVLQERIGHILNRETFERLTDEHQAFNPTAILISTIEGG